MTKKETERLEKIEKTLARVNEYATGVDRRLALLQTEWHKYEKEYKAYIAKTYRWKDRLYAIYYRIRHGKQLTVEQKTQRRMARVFYRGGCT